VAVGVAKSDGGAVEVNTRVLVFVGSGGQVAVGAGVHVGGMGVSVGNVVGGTVGSGVEVKARMGLEIEGADVKVDVGTVGMGVGSIDWQAIDKTASTTNTVPVQVLELRNMINTFANYEGTGVCGK
jgi:hypothetical protein